MRERLLVTLVLIALWGSARSVGAESAQELRGNDDRGRALFEAKHCIQCHQPQGQQTIGPPTEAIRRPQGAFELAGRLWNHAPAMFTMLQKEGTDWPTITPLEMADLMAYLQADSSRDPPPSLPRGQGLLVKKGCLKCHRFRGEGGSVGIELTKYPEGYQSPVAWATVVWNHSPRMAGHAARMGLLYPRFSGDEMGNLLGFLRSAAAPERK